MGEKMSYFQVNEKCNGCLACVQNCPANALSYEDKGEKRTILHNIIDCARCGNCWRICPQEAIEFQHLLVGGWDEVITMDLVRCAVCGEPIYSEEFEHTLSYKLSEEMEPLCPRHRSDLSLKSWHRAIKPKTNMEAAQK